MHSDNPDETSPPAKNVQVTVSLLMTQKWVPLESDPAILTQYSQALGLSRSLAFHDVYSISDPDLLSFVPRPVHALLLVFPVTDTYEKYRREQDEGKDLVMGEDPLDEDIVWFRQTIGNACGTMGVIHSVFNGEVASQLGTLPLEILLTIEPKSPFSNILEKAKKMNTSDRATLLENSNELKSAHSSFSQQGQTRAPSANESVETHYVALVKHVNPKTGKTMLYELDGRRMGPVERNELPLGEDLLGPTALKIVAEFMKRETESGKQDFSLAALGPSLD